MTVGTPVEHRPKDPPERNTTLVWIDSRQAYVVQWREERAVVEHLVSDVPGHHRSTGHARHDPGRYPSGGGIPTADAERQRLEHLARFIELVAGRLSGDDDLLLIGPGTVHGQLARHVAEVDRGRVPARTVRDEPAGMLTQRQMIARLRSEIGAEAPRRTRPPITGSRRRPVPHEPREREPSTLELEAEYLDQENPR
jgi:hypothetical protein